MQKGKPMAEKSPKKNTVWGFATRSLVKESLRSEGKANGGGKSAHITVETGRKTQTPLQIVEGADGIRIFLNPLAGPEAESDPRLKVPPAVRIRDAVGALLGQLEKMEVIWAEFDFQLDAAGVEAALLGLEL